MRNRVRRSLRVCTVLALLGLSACAGQDDATAIRELVEKGAALAEEHDVGGLMKLTTEDFEASPGELDQRETGRILWWAFRHYGDFKIVHPRPHVEIREDEREAVAGFPFLILKKGQMVPDIERLREDPERWLEEVGEAADLYRLELDLVKVGGDWSVRKSRLEAFKGLGFGGLSG